ncbi:hypothetical protein BU16DRAFT_544074 [Lophium mytilinum]|uniref:Uncharacterized protein n=1 Tax=Lophium mytilinum TaxID=390894 RepID=A0A6A6QBC2_9PEZI|nr:hypothetical protein BU16DRAFT_544074 [Lophium mytilinum]
MLPPPLLRIFYALSLAAAQQATTIPIFGLPHPDAQRPWPQTLYGGSILALDPTATTYLLTSTFAYPPQIHTGVSGAATSFETSTVPIPEIVTQGPSTYAHTTNALGNIMTCSLYGSTSAACNITLFEPPGQVSSSSAFTSTWKVGMTGGGMGNGSRWPYAVMDFEPVRITGGLEMVGITVTSSVARVVVVTSTSGAGGCEVGWGVGGLMVVVVVAVNTPAAIAREGFFLSFSKPRHYLSICCRLVARMAPHLKSNVKLEIYLSHSPDHANAFLSSTYDANVVKALEFPTHPAPKGTKFIMPGSRLPHLDFSSRLSSTTTIDTIGKMLESDYGILLSVQSHFRDFGPWFHQYGGYVVLDPTSTLVDAWAVQEDTGRLPWGERSKYGLYPEPGEKTPDLVRIVLVTTAGLIGEMEERREERGVLPWMKRWRYEGNCVKSLRSKVGRSKPSEEAQYQGKLTEHETEWKNIGDMILKRFREWETLIFEAGERHADEVGLSELEATVERAFERWEQWRREKDGESTTLTGETPPGVNVENKGKYPSLGQKYRLFNHLNASQRNIVISKPLRNSQGLLDSRFSSFTIHSGLLRWGQLQTVVAGSTAKKLTRTTVSKQDPKARGGTIIQREYSYRAAARKGEWKVRQAFSNRDNRSGGGSGRPKEHFGWVMYHEDIDPLETVVRCSRLNPSEGFHEAHVDEDILYVNRYDWSMHCHPNSDKSWKRFIRPVNPRFSPKKGGDDDDEYDVDDLEEDLASGYMIAIDADSFDPDFARSFLQDTTSSGERVFLYNEGKISDGKPKRMRREPFGAWVSMPDTEYEYGWLVFSDRTHPDFSDEQELVAIVYDGFGDGLDASEFAVEADPSS